MTLANQIRSLNDKIRIKKAQYSLGKEAAKMFTLSSGKFDKYGYLT